MDEEALLERFRRWLQEARGEDGTEAAGAVPGLESAGADGGLEAHDVGLYRLVEEFTALRHELKLQTKSSRGLQEQSEALLPALKQAIEQFRAVEPRTAEAAWNAAKPLAEALADLDEALERGRVEIEKAWPRLVDEPERELTAELDALLARQSWWRRGRLRGYHARVRDLVSQYGSTRRRPFYGALLEGYALIQARLRRTMDDTQIERIECLGRPVDPGRMIVLEVIDDPTRPPGEVMDEVRRGYTYRGRILRYAEVRASRSPQPPPDTETDPSPTAEESEN